VGLSYQSAQVSSAARRFAIPDADLTTPIFGLTRSELWPVLRAASGVEHVRDFSATIDRSLRDYHGGCGDKLIPTITFTTPAGETQRATVFVKRLNWEGCSEAEHYLRLRQQRFPTPELYGVLADSQGQEILFLEFLEEIGVQEDSIEDWREFFSLMARFNALEITPDYAAVLPRIDYDETSIRRWRAPEGSGEAISNRLSHDLSLPGEWVSEMIRACFEEGRAGDLGDQLAALCRDPEEQLRHIFRSMQALGQELAQMPVGLVHFDFLHDQVGWRNGRREIVLFDIHKNCIGPRFYDAAVYLGLPDWSGPPARLRQMAPFRAELAKHYLAEYARWGGPVVSLQQFERECSLLCWARNLEVTWGYRQRALGRMADDSSDASEARRYYQAHVRSLLTYLLERPTSPSPALLVASQ
jgi:hypothetical protein